MLAFLWAHLEEKCKISHCGCEAEFGIAIVGAENILTVKDIIIKVFMYCTLFVLQFHTFIVP